MTKEQIIEEIRARQDLREGTHYGKDIEYLLSLLDNPEWVGEPPTEQDDYWWWDGDENGEPILVSVLYSGASNKCFAAMGQHGWNRHQWVEDMGGLWMKAIKPTPPSKPL